MSPLFSTFLCLKLFISTGLWHDICKTSRLCGEAGCVLIAGWRPRVDVVPSLLLQSSLIASGQGKACLHRDCGTTGLSCNGMASALVLQAGVFILIRLTSLGHVQLSLATDPEDLHWQLILECMFPICIFLNVCQCDAGNDVIWWLTIKFTQN